MTVYHADRKIGGTVTIRGDEKEPVVAKLGPLGKVTGRLLDLKGQPLAGVEVSIGAPGTGSELYRFAHPSEPVVTDKDGRFTLSGVIPEMKFSLGIRKGQKFYAGKPRIGLLRELKPGETFDLGDRVMKRLQ